MFEKMMDKARPQDSELVKSHVDLYEERVNTEDDGKRSPLRFVVLIFFLAVVVFFAVLTVLYPEQQAADQSVPASGLLSGLFSL
ncbi:MAG: hypothetical protein IJS22_06475 [Lachnospiraceae bacterium]|nr:hypothetical protein [Lachnospiraceae bacterium]